MSLPLKVDARVIGALFLRYVEERAFSAEEIRALELYANHAAIALEKARLFEETHQQLAELEAVNRISTSLRAAESLDDMLPRLLDETLAVLKTDAGIIWLNHVGDHLLHPGVARGWCAGVDAGSIPIPEGIAGHVFATNQTYMSREFATDPMLRPSNRQLVPAGWGGACVPIRTAEQVVGVMFVSVALPRELLADEVHLLTTLAEITGNAIHRTRLHAQTEEQLSRLTALHTIDMAISGSFDLGVTLDVILRNVQNLLGGDAVSVLLLDPVTQTLNYNAGLGFRTSAIRRSRLRLGEGYAGRAAHERRNQRVPDLEQVKENYARRQLLAHEDFVAYHCTPLIGKGEVRGVLEVYHRRRVEPSQEWMSFLDALGVQTAIAIDNAELFQNLQKSNLGLMLAYDETIEGWSRAMDLRDKETEGHTQRVTELAMQLARAMGLRDAELAHLRYGALLHDIGKMGVPDAILLKPGGLTDEEWEVMRKHPDFAYALLSPISYLRDALDIPYAHHEKWDGTGYPRGLTGEAIPLAARLFAVVDVWDALTSDRPYRKAWRADKAREFIREQSGKHFDPRMVEKFLAL